MPASIAICFGPPLVFTLSTINGGNSECISWGVIIQLELPKDLEVLDIVFGENLLIPLPVVALRVATVGGPFGRAQRGTPGDYDCYRYSSHEWNFLKYQVRRAGRFRPGYYRN